MDDKKTVIGKDVIESLTLGMYEDARIIYREYTQNSADQIDKAFKNGILNSIDDGYIWIDIDNNTKTIVIDDNATGVNSNDAINILKNIAQSTKQRGVDKGFRGIGRLGGLAYCDKLIFETTYKGEAKKTVIEWNAKKLKSIINNRHERETASEVIDNITSISFLDEKESEHYFKVILENVSNDSLLNIEGIRNYLSIVAPAKIHPNFTFLSKIKEFSKENNIIIDEYNIEINSEALYKAYTTKIYELSGKQKQALDELKDVSFFEKLSDDGDLLFWGWFGIWSFKKQIPDINLARGIRLRKGNIQIGDEYCLAKHYKTSDKRWNLYTFGEVHAVHPELIPNARRDYFLDNSYLKEFELHLKKIFDELYETYYFSSRVRSAQRDISKLGDLDNSIQEKEKSGFKSYVEKQELEETRSKQQKKAEKAKQYLESQSEKSKQSSIKERVFNELNKDFDPFQFTDKRDGQELQKEEKQKNNTNKPTIIFINDNSLPQQSKENRKLIKRVYDIVDECLPDKSLVENIRLKIIEDFNKVG